MNLSLHNMPEKQLTIEEHIDTYRSKTSSQILVSAKRDHLYQNDNEGAKEDNDYKNNLDDLRSHSDQPDYLKHNYDY